MFGSKHIKRCSRPLQMFGRNFFNTQVNGCLKFIDRIPRCYKNLCSSNQNLYRVFHRTWQVDSIRTKIFLNRVGRITQSNITSLYKATVSNLKSDVLAWGANKTGWKQRIRPENLWENHLVCLPSWVSQAVLVVKNLPVQETKETQVRSLGWVDPLEKEMASHSSILAWRIPQTEKPAGLQSIGSQRVIHDWRDLGPCIGHLSWTMFPASMNTRTRYAVTRRAGYLQAWSFPSQEITSNVLKREGIKHGAARALLYWILSWTFLTCLLFSNFSLDKKPAFCYFRHVFHCISLLSAILR